MYHVMARGDGGKMVFETDDDCLVFLKRLGEKYKIPDSLSGLNFVICFRGDSRSEWLKNGGCPLGRIHLRSWQPITA
jgi:hypothetical protein